MDIRVTLDGRPVDATLNDSPAARDLAGLLPLTLELKDFHGTERIGYPPRKLTTEGAPEPAVARAGDLAYYAPWGNLALFHRAGHRRRRRPARPRPPRRRYRPTGPGRADHHRARPLTTRTERSLRCPPQPGPPPANCPSSSGCSPRAPS
ncbi:cyclophilin-like fold protein [Streptomyces sp. NPDC056160]|uniref:cyclophilin-like fold protein n=1 Tax=Streptomyces sp. NPDC056160 TaxID=3345731 RepID=UPI0035D93CC8